MRTEKEEALKLKKIALSIAKEIKHFWESIQKVCHLVHTYTVGRFLIVWFVDLRFRQVKPNNESNNCEG